MKKTIVVSVISVFISAFSIAQAQPVISAEPQNRTNNIGDNARFTVTATGTGTLAYQWKFQGNNLGGATDSVLNLLLTNANQAGAYTVAVNDDVGPALESGAAALSIPYGDREIITQWNFNSDPPNANTANGVLTPSIGSGTASWPNMGLNNWNDGSSSDPASSGTDNSGRALQGPSVTVANKTGGAQFAVGTVGYKDIAVSWEMLVGARGGAYWRGQYTINGVDWIDRVPVDKRTPFTEAGGQSYTFHTDDLSDVPGAKYNPVFAYRIVAEHEITATGSGEASYVTAEAGNASGYNNTGASRWEMVTILGKTDNSEEQPVIVVQPKSQTAFVGDEVLFEVAAIGNNLQYQWRFGGTNISGATDSSCTLTNVQLSDAGNYSVRVSNAGGFAISDDALLTVEEAIEPGERFFAGDGVTAGTPGTWDTSGINWGLANTGPFDLRWNNASGDSATFENLSGNVTVGESVVVNKMRVINNGTARSISGGSITFVGEDAGIFVPPMGANTSAANSFTIGATPVLQGDVLVKTGGGRLRLSASGSHTVKWIVMEGILSANTGAWFGTAPAELVPDYFTFGDNTGIGFNGTATVSIGATRGIYVRSGLAKFGVASGSTLTFSCPITGPGGVRFPGFSSFPAELSGAAGTFVFTNPGNNYEGATTVAVGTLRCDAAEVLPNTTTVTISGSSILNINGFSQTVGNVILNGANARIQDTVGGASLIATNYDVRQSGIITAALAGTGGLTKTTANIATLSGANTYTGDTVLKNGTIVLNANGTFGSGAGTLHLEASEGPITITLNESRTEATALLNPVLLSGEVQILGGSAALGDIAFYSSGNWTTEGGTLHLFNSSSFALDAYLSGSFNFTQPIMTYTSNTRLTSFNPEGTEQTFSGSINGPGMFRRSVSSGAGGKTIFTTANNYDGGTVVEAGTLLVNNPSGSGTGSGSVTVNGPSGVLGGTGFISGNVVVNDGGSIAPGASAGILTLQNGANLSAGGTMIWELGALKDNADGVAGTDFDQLAIAGGELVLGGSSKLTLQFAEGMAPNGANPFWQANRTWTIVNLNGGQNTANATFGLIVNGSYGAGNFTTSVDGNGNIQLAFAPGAQTPPTITSNPQSRTNIIGTTASFTVVATGSEPLTYEWFRSDAPFTPIAGATNATLLIPNVQPANVGNYFARVSGIGSATSQTASLSVVPAPAIQPLSGAGTTNVVVSWNTIAGAQYQLQYNTNLAIPTWFTITNFVGTGGTFSATNHPPVGDPQRYFRLLIQ